MISNQNKGERHENIETNNSNLYTGNSSNFDSLFRNKRTTHMGTHKLHHRRNAGRILGYVENVANVDYQVERVSRTYTDRNDKSKGYNYSVSIVLDGTDDPLLLFYNGYSHEIESEIETYKMARKWYDDFNNDLAAIIPGAHANYNYSALDASFIGTSEYYDYIKNPDWRVYFNNVSYNYSTINIILPPGTNGSEVDTYFTKLQDKFKEYRVKSAAFVCAVSQEAFDEIIETEELRRNVYIRDERIEWIEDRPE